MADDPRTDLNGTNVRPNHASSDSWFDTFYALTSRSVWRITARTRAKTFHAGNRCGQVNPPALHGDRRANENSTACAECSSFHTQTVWVIGEKYRRQSAAGNQLDPLRFARANAKDRFTDTVLKEDGAAHGTLQQPKRTVYESQWIDEALDGDPQAKHLLYLYLRFVQGHDPVVAGSPLPFPRWAAQLGLDDHATQVENLLARVVDQLRQAKPQWVEKNLDAHTRHLTGHTLLHDTNHDGDTRDTQVPDPRVEIGNDDALDLAAAADTLARAIANPQAATQPDVALSEAITRICGTSASNRAMCHPNWPELVAHVQHHTSRDAA